MSDTTAVRDYPGEIRNLKEQVVSLKSTRDNLVREEATEAQKVKEAQNRLLELGVKNAAEMSLQELEKFEVEQKALLDSQLAEIAKKIEAGNKVVEEMEAISRR